MEPIMQGFRMIAGRILSLLTQFESPQICLEIDSIGLLLGYCRMYVTTGCFMGADTKYELIANG
jgi:hypothetical protein